MAFPLGRLVYNFLTSLDDQQALLEEFEYFRRVFVLIGIVDGSEEQEVEQLCSTLDVWRRRIPHALVAKCIVFNCPEDKENIFNAPNIIIGPRSDFSINSVMRSILCDITAELLEGFSSLEFSIHARSVILSPITDMPHLAPLQRKNSNASIHSLGSSSRPTLTRTPSITSRSVNSVTERSKSLSKGRIENQFGQLYLLAGRVPNALKHFSTAIALSKATGDFLWQGLSLELFTVCLVIMAHLHVDVQIPPNILSMFPSYNDRLNAFGPLKFDALLNFITEMRNVVDQLYQKSTLQPNDAVPGLCFSESILRYAHLLTVVYSCKGFNDNALDHIIAQAPIRPVKKATTYVPNKATICQWIMRAQGQHLNSLSIRERCRIYGAMANMLGSIGFSRLRVKMLRELVASLTPVLLETRRQNASKNGIHPEVIASHTAQSFKSTHYCNILPLISEICQEYGLLKTDGSLLNPELTKWGWSNLQFDVLNELISLCDSLSDYRSILLLISLFFLTSVQTASSSQQISMFKAFRKTYLFASNAGIHINAPYWDPFMITDLKFIGSSENAELIHQRLRNGLPKSIEKGPFIYNPFNRRQDQNQSKSVLVVDEQVAFSIYFRNPLSVSVEVQDVHLETKGVSAKCSHSTFTMRPLSIERTTLTVTPTETGELHIVGCRVKVFGCEPILQYVYEAKDKHKSLHVYLEKSKDVNAELRSLDTIDHLWTYFPFKKDLKTKSFDCIVIASQPKLSLAFQNVTSGKFNFAEYETGELVYVIENTSFVEASHISVLFEDSSSKAFEQAIADKSITADRLYELQFEEFNLPTFTVESSQPFSLSPGERREIHIKIRAKPNSQEGLILFESSVHKPEDTEFYVRRLRIPVSLNISKRVDLKQWSAFMDTEGDPSYCLVLLNFYNHFSEPLFVTVKTASTDESRSVLIKPKADNVILFRLKRFIMSSEEINLDIPNLSTKQFVLSSGFKKSIEDSYTMKKRFWIKEYFLKEVQASWKTDDNLHHGEIYLRNHILSDEMANNLSILPIRIQAWVSYDSEKVTTVCPREPFKLVLEFFGMQLLILHIPSYVF